MASILQDLSPIGLAVIGNDAAKLPAFNNDSGREETLALHSAESLDSSWKEFYRDPSQWWDNRRTKTNPRSPDFKHKANGFNPCWVQEELRGRGFEATGFSASKEDEVLSNEEKKPLAITAQRIHSAAIDDELCLGQRQPIAGLMAHSSHKSQREDNQKEVCVENTHTTAHFMTQSDMGTQTEGRQQSMVVSKIEAHWNTEDKTHNNFDKDVSDPIDFVHLLKDCADGKDLVRGSLIHADVVRLGLVKSNLIIGSTVVNMYAKCGALARAQEVFNELPVRHTIIWNALISGYTQHERGQEALNCFERMQSEGVSPDVVTIVCILNACGSLKAINKGQEIHALVIKEGLLEINVVVANALVNMYACCQVLFKARDVFYELPIWDVVSWTTLITGFVRHGHGKKALDFFHMMQLSGFVPNLATRLGVLKACGIEGAVCQGQEVHAALLRDGSLGNNMVAGTALVDMYAKCCALAEAERVFEELPMQDVVSWGALLEGYAQHTDGEKALYCYERMQGGGIAPDAATFVCVLKASGSVGATAKGQEVHSYIAREGMLQRDIVVMNSLIDMYAKCGMLVEAHNVFDELLVRDIVSWNALIAGYAQLGEEEIVFSLYDRMIGEGIEPDHVTFMTLLNACCHRGLLSKCQIYFVSMSTVYGISPTLELLTCMVDLFGRAGQIDKAAALIQAMPVHADRSAWQTVLSACQSLGNMKLGNWVFEQALSLDKKHSISYVCISDAYASLAKEMDSEEMEGFVWE